MRARSESRWLLAAAMLCAAALPAAAADCTLKMAASVDTARGEAGAMLVPVSIADAHKLLLLDTGGFFSELTPKTVTELGLSTRHVGVVQYDVSGRPADQIVEVQNFSLGRLNTGSMQFMVAPGEIGGNKSDISGVLAPNLLSAYDLDLDFPNNKLKLMSPDHCPGQVVYWPHTVVAVIPMRVTEGHRIVFPMELDGHRVQAILDTGATHTALSMRTAQTLFGLNANSPDVEPAGRLTDKTGSGFYSHGFKTLSVEGVTITNPSIYLIPDLMRNYMMQDPFTGSRLSSNNEPQGLPDLLLGMSVLQHLHVYVAYKEQMLYITAGEPVPAQRGGASGR